MSKEQPRKGSFISKEYCTWVWDKEHQCSAVRLGYALLTFVLSEEKQFSKNILIYQFQEDKNVQSVKGRKLGYLYRCAYSCSPQVVLSVFNMYLFMWLPRVLALDLHRGSSVAAWTLWLPGPRAAACGLVSCSASQGSQFPDQGSNPHPLHCKVDS